MEKIRRNDDSWGQLLESPGKAAATERYRGNANGPIECIDNRALKIGKWEAFYRGASLVLAAVVAFAALAGVGHELLNPALVRAQDAGHGISEQGTRAYLTFFWVFTLIPIFAFIALLLVPKPNPTFVCRATRKVYGSAGLTGLGRWVELDFDRITAVSVIERRYHQAGRTTTYSLWLCEVDPKTDRITKRIVAMQPSRLADVPEQTWGFIRSYMNLPPEQVPSVLLWRGGIRWADRVYSANQRLFGMLLDQTSFQIEGPISRGFAVWLGGLMYPWEITGWLLDRLLHERRAPPGLRQVLSRPAQQPNPYRISGGNDAEEIRVQAVLRADGWVHATGIALSVVLYGLMFWMWSQAGGA